MVRVLFVPQSYPTNLVSSSLNKPSPSPSHSFQTNLPGGAGKLGKMIFSYNEKKWSACAYIPSDKTPVISAKEWLAEVVTMVANTACVADIKTFEGRIVFSGVLSVGF